MLKTWVIYSVSLISTFIFFLCYKMWVSWFCLIVILLVPFLALLLCVIASQTMTYEVECPTDAPVGVPLYIRITINGTASYFAFCRINAEVTDHMAGTKKKLALIIHDKGTSKIPVDTSHCGSFTYKMPKIDVYDLFGFFHFSKTINKDKEILVMPVPAMPEVMPDMFGFKAKNLRKAKQPHTEIYDIRDYQMGDPVKTIHWKMSAKKDKLLVKEPLEEYGGHSRVILKLTHDRYLMDLHLGQILFTSRFFIEHETPHKIRIIPPDRREIAFEVESETDLQRAIAMILRMRIPDDLNEESHDRNDMDEPGENIAEEVSHED